MAKSLKSNIRFENQKDIAGALQRLLADTYSLYFKTHGFHWNVEGPHFQQLHALFEVQYNELWLAIDELAERLRALGDYAPSSSAMMAKNSKIEEVDTDMLVELANDHGTVAQSAREVLRLAEEGGDDATSDIVSPRVMAHEKTMWMLRAQSK